MNINVNNYLIKLMIYRIQRYNPRKYWHNRAIVVNQNNKTPRFIKLLKLLYIKKCDAFNNASMGTDLNSGAIFDSPPTLPHGLNGIVIAHQSKIGKNCTILHQVTLAGKNGKGPTIGDNVLIGAGAKIIGGIIIGNNCVIGANAVVTKSFPDNVIIAGVPAVIVKNRELKSL